MESNIKIEELVKLKEQGLTDKQIAEHFIEQGKNIKINTVSQRLYRYYKSQGKEKPKSNYIKERESINIEIEELVQLRDQGLTYKQIVEKLASEGIIISVTYIGERLRKYYKSQGKQLSNSDSKQIEDEELVLLRKQGLTYRQIAEKLEDEGIIISVSYIHYRLRKYYKSQGKKIPNLNSKPIEDEKLALLREQGLTYKQIVEKLASEGIIISVTYIGERLRKYYKSQGKKIPNLNSKPIEDEKLALLREQGLTYKQIVEKLESEGIIISDSYIGDRLRKYYKSQGIRNPRAILPKKQGRGRAKIQISDEKLYRLREQGLSYRKIAEKLRDEGIIISDVYIGKRLRKYYKSQGEKILGSDNQKSINLTNEEIEEIVLLYEKGLKYYEIAMIFESGNNNSKKIHSEDIEETIIEYYETFGKQKLEQTTLAENEKGACEDKLKDILMRGMTLQEYVLEYGEDKRESIELMLKKLKVVVECAKKNENEFIADDDFVELINLVENSPEILNKYERHIGGYVDDGKCNFNGIDKIKENVFGGNIDMMVYLLQRLNLTYHKGYDTRAAAFYKKQFEAKIDRYLNRLHSVEERRIKNKNNSENNGNSEISREER